MNWELAKESIVFPVAVILCGALLPFALPLFSRLGMVDRPNARSAHTTAIPRGAGVVVVLSFAAVIVAYSTALSWYPLGDKVKLDAFLWAILLLVMLGLLDDKRGVPASVKLIVQVGTALILVLAGFVMPLPAIFGEHQAAFARGLTLVWIVGVINAINFIDGSDGLATTLSTLCMLVFVGISRILPAQLANEEAAQEISRTINLLGLAGAGGAVPFLLYNLSPAKCFLGDAGSTFFGLLLAVLGILTAGYYKVDANLVQPVGFAHGYLLVPWLVLFVPIADAARVTVDRVRCGKSPFHADNRHLHHLLHRAGLSANQIVFLVGLTVTIFGMLAAIVVRSSHSPYLITGILILLVYGLVWFVQSSYRARRFVTLALNRRLLHFMEVTEGYENAVSFKERFEQELSRARRHGASLSTVVLNTTPCKVNPKVPNPVENPKFLDNLLRALRREDIKCRFSNDRLAFLLVETDREIAGRVCDRIRSRFEAIRNGDSAELQVGIGFASFPEDGGSVTALLRVAESRALREMSQPRTAEGPAGLPAVGSGDGIIGPETEGELAMPKAGAAQSPPLPEARAPRNSRWAGMPRESVVPQSRQP